MQQWEYKISFNDEPDFFAIEDKWNELGKEGWELIAVDVKRQKAFFKRPVKPIEPIFVLVNGFFERVS